jgi:hypothetical protein
MISAVRFTDCVILSLLLLDDDRDPSSELLGYFRSSAARTEPAYFSRRIADLDKCTDWYSWHVKRSSRLFLADSESQSGFADDLSNR